MAHEEFDAAAEEQWQDENREWELTFEAFRHLVIGVGTEWSDRLYVDDSRMGDADEHAERAARYGWATEDYRMAVEGAELVLGGY